MPEDWITFEGYSGRYRRTYGGGYAAGGFRFPYVEADRSWDIVRVDGGPAAGRHPEGTFVVVDRGFDMMGKAYAQLAAHRRHFAACAGVGVCAELGHPGGPRRSSRQALSTGRGSDGHRLPDAGDRSTDAPTSPLVPPPVHRDAGVIPLDWITALRPTGPVTPRRLAGRIDVRVVPLAFPPWPGPPLGMAEDCNKRGGRVTGDAGELSCAEVEIVKRLRRAGWDAAWVSPFRCGERRWGPYRLAPDDLPRVIREFEARIAMGEGGRPDVVAWTESRVVYVESKGPGDALRATQIGWLTAASSLDSDTLDLAIVEWVMMPPTAVLPG